MEPKRKFIFFERLSQILAKSNTSQIQFNSSIFFSHLLSAKHGRLFAKMSSSILFAVFLPLCSVTLQLFPLKDEVSCPSL